MFEVFDRMTHQWTRTCYEQLKDFIYRRQEVLFDLADAQREAIDSLDALEDYNRDMRSRFIASIGGLEETACELNASVKKRLDCGGFILEAVIFQSRPGVYVTGSMYIPKSVSLPAPAVLFLCGHAQEGRMDEGYQQVCRILVQAGLIVFAIDPTGQGERGSFFDPATGKHLIERTVPDHDACGVPAVATGRFLQRMFLCDEMRAVDYMLTRPEIDPGRIGVTGNSGGGTQTVAMMICDERIAAAAPGTFVTSRREYMYTGQAQDSEQIWPGITGYGFDHVNAFMIFAPRPAMILATKYDFFPIEGTRETFQTARRFYGMYGAQDRIRLTEDAFTHSYTPALALSAASFFSEVLCGKRVSFEEPPFTPLPPREMYATKSGNVGELKNNVFLPEETKAYARLLREERGRRPSYEQARTAREWLHEQVFRGRMPTDFNARIFPKQHCAQVDGFMGTSVSWWTQKRLFAFGDMIKPESLDGVNGLPTVIALWNDGTQKISAHEAWIRAQCKKGRQVFVPDVPGVGGIEQRNMVINAPYKDAYGTLYTLCGDLMYMGDSLAAMRCYDVLRTIDMLQAEFGIKEEDLCLYCDDDDGIYGVLAAFVHDSIPVIPGKDLMRGIEAHCFGERMFVYRNTLTYLIPGILKYCDIGELLKWLEEQGRILQNEP